MFLGRKIDSNTCAILDTSDFVEDIIDSNTVYTLLDGGFQIYGLSTYILDSSSNINILIRMYDDCYEPLDFNGYLLEPICEEYDEDFWHIIEFSEHEDLRDFSSFCKVVEFIRNANNIDLDSLTSEKELGYSFEFFDNGFFKLRDLQTNDIYSCDYFDCMNIYNLNNLGISGITEITDSYIASGNYKTYFLDSLKRYWTYSLDVEFTSIEPDIINIDDDIETYYHNNNKSLRYFGYFRFPLLNLKDYLKKSSISLGYETPVTNVPYDLDMYKEKGRNWGYLATKLNILSHDDEVRDAIRTKLLGIAAKSVLLEKKDVYCIEDCLKNSSVILDSKSEFNLPKFRGCSRYNHLSDFSLSTKFGDIDVTGSGIKIVYEDNALGAFNLIWLLRVTHTGSCWYNLGKHFIDYGTMTTYNKDSGLHSEYFLEFTKQCQKHGISFYNDCIIPLCVSNIIVKDNYVDIRLACITRDGKSLGKRNWGTTALNIVEIPLIYCGGKFIEYEDCYAYYCGLQTIYFSKSLINNLYGYFNISVLESPWANTGDSKVVKGLKKHSIDSMIRMLAGVYNDGLQNI